jgi:hypothetical protein
MADAIDLDYDPSSFVGPFELQEAREFEKWWLTSGYPFKLDGSYIQHLSQYHGGKPGKQCFRTQSGRERVLERFLNFVKDYKKGKWGVYHVEVMRCLIEDRLNEYLLPFAVLFGGDMLCFDYTQGERPAVVVWMHEESADAGAPVTEPVAPDFAQFLRLLHPCETGKPSKKKKGS